jgi:Ca2+-binding EF-hand superfamily protein
LLSSVGPDLKAPKFTPDQFKKIMTDQVNIPWKKKEVGEWFSEFDKNDTGKIFYPFFVNYMKTFGELK